MNSQAALLFISGPLAGKGRKIKSDVTVIGRSSSCDICIADASISREHAKIINENGVFSIKDLGSHNGIKVNDSRHELLVLKNGMRFRLGTAEIEFWDGTGAPPALSSQEFATPIQGESLSPDNKNDVNMKAPASNIDELKHKRVMNIVILISILTMVVILGISVFFLMNKTVRPIHYRFIEMYTDEDRVIDLNFTPRGESEKFLKPFVVYDYSGFTTTFKNIVLDHDIIIVKEKDLIAPPMSSVILIRTKLKTGQGEITFYTDDGKDKKIIGVLKIDVIRRPIPDVLEKYLNADLENKIVIADDMYQLALKYEGDTNKIKEVWTLLKNSKLLFENGEAKPEIYTKIDKKYSELNKSIERSNKQLLAQYELDKKKEDYLACYKSLEKIAMINPDEENLYRQKAILNSRRIKPLIK